jgi:hypothetical protein
MGMVFFLPYRSFAFLGVSVASSSLPSCTICLYCTVLTLHPVRLSGWRSVLRFRLFATLLVTIFSRGGREGGLGVYVCERLFGVGKLDLGWDWNWRLFVWYIVGGIGAGAGAGTGLFRFTYAVEITCHLTKHFITIARFVVRT